MLKALDYAYDKSLSGIDNLVSSYLAKNFYDKEKAIDSLINWQTSKVGFSGFVTGLGRLITLPVAIPANVSTVIYFQINMVSAIAKLRGYDLHDD